MPKMKTNRLAHKKFRVGGTGRIKHAHASTSHNTGKKSSKRMRRLRGRVIMDRSMQKTMERVLPNHGVK